MRSLPPRGEDKMPDDLPVTPEMVQFAVRVAKLTNGDKLEWETTADEDTLLAPLGGPYTAKLERHTVTDDNDNAVRYIELALLKARQELFRLAPGSLYETSFTRLLGAP